MSPRVMLSVLSTAGSRVLRWLVLVYRWGVSPLLASRCRYLPTCSDYALEALDRHGPARGGWLVLKRLARCHPLGGCGFDPVPHDHERHQRV